MSMESEDFRKEAEDFLDAKRERREKWGERTQQTIPDDWRRMLHDRGFSDEAIHDMLISAHEIYRQEKGRNEAEQKARAAARILEEQYNKHLAPEEIEYMARSYEDHIRNEQDWTQDE